MAVLPRLIRPMLAALRPSLPADQDRYGWEFKWDGVRAIAHVSGGEVRLVSRNDKDMAASYPELAVLAGRVGAPVILDAEIVALRAGRPDFGALQSRMHVRRPRPRPGTWRSSRPSSSSEWQGLVSISSCCSCNSNSSGCTASGSPAEGSSARGPPAPGSERRCRDRLCCARVSAALPAQFRRHLAGHPRQPVRPGCSCSREPGSNARLAA